MLLALPVTLELDDVIAMAHRKVTVDRHATMLSEGSDGLYGDGSDPALTGIVGLNAVIPRVDFALGTFAIFSLWEFARGPSASGFFSRNPGQPPLCCNGCTRRAGRSWAGRPPTRRSTGMEELPQVPLFPLEQFDREEPVGETEDGATGGQERAGAAPPHYESVDVAGPLPLHYLAMVFPDATPAEDEALARNIRENGQLEPIVVTGDPPRVVDGRRRQRACLQAGVTPVYQRIPASIDPRNFVWSMNAERRHLTQSQKAFSAAQLHECPGPGRPPAAEENSAILQNLIPTMERVAMATGISARLLGDARRVADTGGTATTELREAVRNGLVTVSAAAQDRVLRAPPEVQRRAVAMVRNGESRTASAAVDRLMAGAPEPGTEPEADPDPDTTARVGDRVTLHVCPVAGLVRRLQPGSVDLIVACPAQDAVLVALPDLAELARRALAPGGLLAVAILDTGPLPRVMGRLAGGELQWIMEMNIFFPYPVARSAGPHRVSLRRAALLLYGRPGARVEAESDVIEVPAVAAAVGDPAAALSAGLALGVGHLASQGQVVCDPGPAGGSGMALAATAAGCSFVGAHEDRDVIDAVLAALAGDATGVGGY